MALSNFGYELNNTVPPPHLLNSAAPPHFINSSYTDPFLGVEKDCRDDELLSQLEHPKFDKYFLCSENVLMNQNHWTVNQNVLMNQNHWTVNRSLETLFDMSKRRLPSGYTWILHKEQNDSLDFQNVHRTDTRHQYEEKPLYDQKKRLPLERIDVPKELLFYYTRDSMMLNCKSLCCATSSVESPVKFPKEIEDCWASDFPFLHGVECLEVYKEVSDQWRGFSFDYPCFSGVMKKHKSLFVTDVTDESVKSWMKHPSNAVPEIAVSSVLLLICCGVAIGLTILMPIWPYRMRAIQGFRFGSSSTSAPTLHAPRHPEYVDVQRRISSFHYRSPSLHYQSSTELAEAGFFFSGNSHDSTSCFYCGGELENWRQGDNPYVEHARRFPQCDFIRQVKRDRSCCFGSRNE